MPERRYVTNTASHVDFFIYKQIDKKPVLAIEMDGFHYHKPGTWQVERDKMKERILKSYEIPLLRFPTNGSGKPAQIEAFLDRYTKGR